MTPLTRDARDIRGEERGGHASLTRSRDPSVASGLAEEGRERLRIAQRTDEAPCSLVAALLDGTAARSEDRGLAPGDAFIALVADCACSDASAFLRELKACRDDRAYARVWLAAWRMRRCSVRENLRASLYERARAMSDPLKQTASSPEALLAPWIAVLASNQAGLSQQVMRAVDEFEGFLIGVPGAEFPGFVASSEGPVPRVQLLDEVVSGLISNDDPQVALSLCQSLLAVGGDSEEELIPAVAALYTPHVKGLAPNLRRSWLSLSDVRPVRRATLEGHHEMIRRAVFEHLSDLPGAQVSLHTILDDEVARLVDRIEALRVVDSLSFKKVERLCRSARPLLAAAAIQRVGQYVRPHDWDALGWPPDRVVEFTDPVTHESEAWSSLELSHRAQRLLRSLVEAQGDDVARIAALRVLAKSRALPRQQLASVLEPMLHDSGSALAYEIALCLAGGGGYKPLLSKSRILAFSQDHSLAAAVRGVFATRAAISGCARYAVDDASRVRSCIESYSGGLKIRDEVSVGSFTRMGQQAPFSLFEAPDGGILGCWERATASLESL